MSSRGRGRHRPRRICTHTHTVRRPQKPKRAFFCNSVNICRRLHSSTHAHTRRRIPKQTQIALMAGTVCMHLRLRHSPPAFGTRRAGSGPCSNRQIIYRQLNKLPLLEINQTPGSGRGRGPWMQAAALPVIGAGIMAASNWQEQHNFPNWTTWTYAYSF